jgi:NTE family protein
VIIKNLKQLWLNTTTDVFGINSKLIESIKEKKLNKENIKLGYDNIKLLLKNKGIDTNDFLNIIKENIDEDKLRKSKVKFGLITVKITDKGFEPLEITIDDIPKGKVAEYILASCYLPLFNYKPIIDNSYYIDGGFYNNVPLDLAEKYGCNTIYSIRIKGIGVSRNKLKKTTKVIEIKPKINLGSIILFDRDSNFKNLQLGYFDTLKLVDNLDGNDYYFKSKKDYYYNQIVKNVDEKLLKKLKLRFFCKSNKELVINVIEYLLDKNKITNLKIYNIKIVIWYLKKHNKVMDKDILYFIYSCKLL